MYFYTRCKYSLFPPIVAGMGRGEVCITTTQLAVLCGQKDSSFCLHHLQCPSLNFIGYFFSSLLHSASITRGRTLGVFLIMRHVNLNSNRVSFFLLYCCSLTCHDILKLFYELLPVSGNHFTYANLVSRFSVLVYHSWQYATAFNNIN